MIICAAVLFEKRETGEQVCLRVHRHGDAYRALADLGFKSGDFKTIEQGFIAYEVDPDDPFNGEEIFLNRKEALDYAKRERQILTSMSDDELYSEDLW